jgi:tetratricopeptide (TPR) repeat protein
VFRLVGFFFASFFLLQVLRGLFAGVPILGWIFGIPLIGFWIVAAGLSAALSKLASEGLDRSKRAALVRRLGAVETPHNLGKLGCLFASQGRHRRALTYLERAAAGEPEVAEWHYRLGTTLLALARTDEALVALTRALELDPEHAYGEARMRQAEALAHQGAHDQALTSLETLERFHGPSPESAYRRGRALAALGRRDEARVALGEVAELARTAAKYQKRSSTAWVLKARLASMI